MNAQEAAAAVRLVAVMPAEARDAMVAAALFVLAVETGVHPRDCAHALASSPRWPTDEEWHEERPRLERVVRNSRASYRLGDRTLEPELKRPQG